MATSTSLRKHINSFLKHVHPDLFHEEGDCERVNLDSLQKLHCFIDEIPRYLELKFYVKANPQLAYGDELPPSISAKFTLPSDLFDMRDRTVQKRAIVGSAVRQVVDLLKQAGISIPANEELSLPEPAQSPLASTSRTSSMWVSDVATDMNDAFYDALRQYRSNIIVEERVAGTKQYERIIQRAELSSLFNPANVYFHPKLSVEQQRQGLRRLKGNLTRLGFEQWCDLPIFMTENEWSAAAHRAIVVPYNFTLREMRLYLLNELPRIQAERKKFQIALANATDLADNLIDTTAVGKISITSELHPADAADIIRNLTALLKPVYNSPEHDEELAIALENTHFILTRQVVHTEVRTRTDEFMVLLPRNFNGFTLFDTIKDEFQSWSERGHSRSRATEKLHDSGMISAYTSAMGLPVTALTAKPPEPEDDAEAAGGDGQRADEVGLSEEEKKERQRQRTLKTLFGAYLTARTKSDKPFLSGWAASLLEARPEDEHTAYELRALSLSLLPLSAFADIATTPVHVLADKKLAALPAGAREVLANDKDVLEKFATLVEQLQSFAVVLRDVVPDMVQELPRSLHTMNAKLPGDLEGAVAEKLSQAFDKDVHDLHEEEALADAELELHQSPEDEAEEQQQREAEDAELGLVDEEEKAAEEEDEEGAAGEGEVGALAEEELEEEELADGKDGEPAFDATQRDYPDPITVPFELPETLAALQEIASAVPRETPMGDFYHQLFTALKNLELMEHVVKGVISEDLASKGKGEEEEEEEEEKKKKKHGLAEKKDEEDEDVDIEETEGEGGNELADGKEPKGDAITSTRRSLRKLTMEPDLDEIVGAPAERDDDLDIDEPDLDLAADDVLDDEDGEDLEGGGVDGEEAVVYNDDEIVPNRDEDEVLDLDPENAMKVVQIQKAISNSEVKNAFAATLKLAYLRNPPPVLQDALAAVAMAHDALQAAVEQKLKSS